MSSRDSRIVCVSFSEEEEALDNGSALRRSLARFIGASRAVAVGTRRANAIPLSVSYFFNFSKSLQHDELGVSK